MTCTTIVACTNDYVRDVITHASDKQVAASQHGIQNTYMTSDITGTSPNMLNTYSMDNMSTDKKQEHGSMLRC
jgi:hypothetical protein